MAIALNDNLFLNAPLPLDGRTHKIVAGVAIPFASVGEALASPQLDPLIRIEGITALIQGATDIEEWWFAGGIDNGSFKKKLGGTADTDATVKSKYESNPDTNAYTDYEKSKLAGIQDGANINNVNTTIQGNTFNVASSLVQMRSDGKLPPIDGSLLTNLPIANGGSGLPAITDGSVIFGKDGTFSQDNAQLYYNQGKLSVGTTVQPAALTVRGQSVDAGVITTFKTAAGNTMLQIVNGSTDAYIVPRINGPDTYIDFFSGLNVIRTNSGLTTAFGVSGYPGIMFFNIQNQTGNAAFNLGINVYGTAKVHIAAGTATAGTAPLKINPGVLLTTLELGAIEFVDNGTTGHLYITMNVAGVLTRVQIA